MSCRMWSTVLWHTPTSAANSRAVHQRSTSSKEARSSIVWLSTWGRPERWLSWMESLPSRNNFTHCATVRYGKAASPRFSQSLKTGLSTTTSSNFNFYPGALVLFRKHVVRALELGFYTSRRCTMQLNQTQPSPLTVLLQLNLCYQVQTTVVSPDAHPSSYSSVATTLYPTLVCIILIFGYMLCNKSSESMMQVEV